MPKSDQGKKTSHHNQMVAGQEEHNSRSMLIYGVLFLLLAVIWAVGTTFHLFVYQLVEPSAIILAVALLVTSPKKKKGKKKGESDSQPADPTPKQKPFIPHAKDRKCLAQSITEGKTLLGWDDDGEPVYWADKQRTLQTVLAGASGVGKSTVMYNILEQDIMRGHSIILIDGKGAQDMMADLIECATKAGRANDLRIIDPTHPETSHRYNPFYDPDGKNLLQRIDLIFNALPASDPKGQKYFVEAQFAAFTALVWVISQVEPVPTFASLSAYAQDEAIIKWLIDNVPTLLAKRPNVPDYVREAVDQSIGSLKRRYESTDWNAVLDGLFNAMSTFVGSEISEIMNSTEDLVSLREVIEKRLILLAPINTNANSRFTMIGNMLMRDLQAQIGNRYKHSGDRSYDMNFISVVLDEFGLFATPSFSGLVNTARAANVAMIFSVQSEQMLAGQLNQAFAKSIVNDPNNKLIMQGTDSETILDLSEAGGTELVTQLSEQVYKAGVLTAGEYESLGRGTEQTVERARVSASAIRRLPQGQMFAVLPDPQIGPEPIHVYGRYPMRYGLRGNYVSGIPQAYIAARNERIKAEAAAKEGFTQAERKAKRRGRL